MMAHWTSWHSQAKVFEAAAYGRDPKSPKRVKPKEDERLGESRRSDGWVEGILHHREHR